MPYVGSRFKLNSLPATIVSTDVSNTFTQPQKIKGTVSTLFTLYRNGIHSNNATAGLDISLENAANAEKIYAQFLGVIEDGTTSSEKGSIILRVLHTGQLRNALKINNDGSIEWGTPSAPSAKFSAAGLSGLKTFTFPNADTMVAGIDIQNVFSTVQKVSSALSNALTLHRQTNTIGSGVTQQFDLNDNASAEKTYGRIDVVIDDNTAGSEDSQFIVRLMAAGTLGQAITLDETGLLKIGVANVQRVRLDCATGLTGARTYTFPNATTMLAGVDVTNIFSDDQKIQVDQANLFTLYRPNAAAGLTVSYNLNNASAVEKTYARIDVTSDDGTVGSEDGLFIIRLRSAGTLGAALSFDETGLFKLGVPGVQRVRLDCATGLTGIRTFTFPDVSQQLIGQIGAITLSNKTLDSTCNVSAAIGGGGGGGGTALKTPMATYLIRKDVTNYVAVNMTTNVEDYTNSDFYTVLNSVHGALVTAGKGKIILGPGDFSLVTKPTWTANNVVIDGCGVDVTRILLNTTNTVGTAIQLGDKTTPTAVNLTADTLKGERIITVASTTGFVAGDWIHLTHEVTVDITSATRFDAEFHQIKSVDSGTQLTIDNGVYSDYLTADTARFYKVTWLKNFTFRNLTIYDNRTSVATPSDGPLFCVYCYNLTLDNVKLDHMAHDAIRPESCFHVNLNNLYIDDVQSTVDATDILYGVYICGSTTNLSWVGGWANKCRHSVTNNTNSGNPYRRGKQRNLTFSSVKSYNANVAHFDMHQCAIGVTFNGCVALGAHHSSISTDSQGFNLRSPATLNGCVAQHIQHEAMVVWIDSDVAGTDFKPGGDRTVFNGCTIIAPVRADPDTNTRGIVIQTGRRSVIINACQFFDINMESILIEEDTSDIIISNNMFHTCGEDLSSSDGIITCLGDIDRLNVTNNNFSAGTPAGSGRPLVFDAGTVDYLRFSGNDVSGLTNKIPLIQAGSTNVLADGNPGLNPINKIATAVDSTNHTIGFYGGGTAAVVASTDYTIVGTDILMTCTTATSISITIKDGAGNNVVTGLTTLNAQSIPNGYKVNFGPFTGTAPTVTVFAR